MLYCILFCLPALMTLAGAIYLLVRKEKSHVTSTLAYMYLLLTAALACYAQFYNPYIIARQSWGFDLAYTIIAPFCAPVYFLFINRLTQVKRTPVLDVVSFIPSIIFLIFILFAYLLATDAERHAYIALITQGKSAPFATTGFYDWLTLIGYQVCRYLIASQIILVIVYGEIRIKSYIKLLGDYYSSIDSTDVIRIRGIHTMSILLIIMALGLVMLPTHEWARNIFLAVVIIILEMLILGRIVIYTDKVEYSAENLRAMLDATALNQSDASMAGEGVLKALIDKMDTMMIRDRLFLNPSLSLMMLSETIGTNRTYVSQAIKQSKGCNFSDYVNRFRIDYALELMAGRQKSDLLVQNIAVECGCGSVQTFYRYFKLFYDTTPTAWIEENLK